jgi:hypothetical protein
VLLKKLPHNKIYIGALMLFAASLSLSYGLMSISLGLLTLNWLLEGQLGTKFRKVAHSRSLLLLLSIYVIHLIGMLYTSDMQWGLHDLNVKLPLLLLPLIVATSPVLDDKQLKILMHTFMGAVLLASFIVTTVIFHIYNRPWNDIRETSFIISHIRFGLMIVIAIFSSIYYCLHEKQLNLKLGYFALIIWYFIFLLLLQALTGLVVFFFTMIIVFLVFRKKEPYCKYQGPVGVVMVSLISVSIVYSVYAVHRFYDFKPLPQVLPAKTVNGNLYYHNPAHTFVENGNKVYIYICDKELREGWKKRSNYPYDSLDRQQQVVQYTLIRYLASKGLTRDSAGIAQLTDADIRNIESGYANYIFAHKGIYPKLYTIIWEFYDYRNNCNPSGHSVTQRFSFLQNVFHIIRDHKWFGVGTGDIKKAVAEQYKKDNSFIEEKFQKRAHNQIVTFFATFGIPFTLIIIVAFVLPPFWEHRYRNYFFLVCFCVSMMSFVNEDTLETLPGVSFVALFLSLFLFGTENDEKLPPHNG